METKAVTNQIRLSQWNQIVHDRNESGLSVADYCEQHELSINAYYYWLRKIRQAAIEASGIHFSELTAPANSSTCNSSSVIVELNNARICINNAESRDIFSMVVEVLSHA